MITNAPLTPEQQKRSRLLYSLFSLMNGFSYICLGENIIILIAIRMDQPNVVVSALGGMIYFGYLLLPLGRRATAHGGAVFCQSFFWVIRNLASFFVVIGALLNYAGYRLTATILLLFASFVFYGARAAGIAVIQPMFGEITAKHNRAAFLGRTSAIAFGSSFVTLSGISLILYYCGSDLRYLCGIAVCGSIAGILSSRVLARMQESGALRESARIPVMQVCSDLMKDPVFRKYLNASFITYLSLTLLTPICLLTVKRGYGISDTAALFYSIFQLLATSVIAIALRRYMRSLGPRRFCAISYAAYLIIPVLWLLAPATPNALHLSVIFSICGLAFVGMMNPLTMYFLQTVDESRQVMGSLIAAVAGGAGAGVCGIFISGGLLKLAEYLAPSGASSLTLFRIYFAAAGLFLLPGLLLILRMKPLPLEKRYPWHLGLFANLFR